jgi:Protein of unknown function (DUF3015)
MKRIVLGSVLMAASCAALAEAPGGPGCGWGNMLFEGHKGLPSHLVASTTNASSGNATFGMTSGTNGCRTDGPLKYQGKPMLVVSTMMDELSEDMAKGEGEALTTYAVVLGVSPEDRAHFKHITNQHFAEIFSSADVTAEQVLSATLSVMKRDEQLAKYAEA